MICVDPLREQSGDRTTALPFEFTGSILLPSAFKQKFDEGEEGYNEPFLTPERVVWTNWTPFEPDNSNGDQNSAVMQLAPEAKYAGRWQDVPWSLKQDTLTLCCDTTEFLRVLDSWHSQAKVTLEQMIKKVSPNYYGDGTEEIKSTTTTSTTPQSTEIEGPPGIGELLFLGEFLFEVL